MKGWKLANLVGMLQDGTMTPEWRDSKRGPSYSQLNTVFCISLNYLPRLALSCFFPLLSHLLIFYSSSWLFSMAVRANITGQRWTCISDTNATATKQKSPFASDRRRQFSPDILLTARSVWSDGQSEVRHTRWREKNLNSLHSCSAFQFQYLSDLSD